MCHVRMSLRISYSHRFEYTSFNILRLWGTFITTFMYIKNNMAFNCNKDGSFYFSKVDYLFENYPKTF